MARRNARIGHVTTKKQGAAIRARTVDKAKIRVARLERQRNELDLRVEQLQKLVQDQRTLLNTLMKSIDDVHQRIEALEHQLERSRQQQVLQAIGQPVPTGVQR